MTTTFVNPQDAFQQALDTRVLTLGNAFGNCVDEFMYMGTKDGKHAFKHIDSRQYLYCPAN